MRNLHLMPAAVSILLIAFMAACAGQPAVRGLSSKPGPDQLPAVGAPKVALPRPSTVKLGTFVPDGFVRRGADYLPGQSSNVLAGPGATAVFNPDFPDQPQPDSEFAWALYSFNSSGFDREQAIRYKLQRPLPAGSRTYIGAANWATDRWDWFILNGSGKLPLVFAPYEDGSQQMLLAFVAVGESPTQLTALKLGAVGTWVRSVGGPEDDDIGFVGVTAGSNDVYAGGASYSFNGGQPAALACKFDEDGELLWTRVIARPDEAMYLRDWAMTPSGNLVGLAEYRSPNELNPDTDDQNPLVFMLDSDGALRWSRRLALLGFNYGGSLVATDRIVFTGVLDGAENGLVDDDLLVVSLDLDGELIGATRVDNGGENGSTSLVAAEGGTAVYVELRGVNGLAESRVSRCLLQPDGGLGDPEALPVLDSMSAGLEQSGEDTEPRIDMGFSGDPGAHWLDSTGAVKWARKLDFGFGGNAWNSQLAGDDLLYLVGRSTAVSGEAAFLASFDGFGTLGRCFVWSGGGECYTLDTDNFGNVYCGITGVDDARGEWITHNVTSSDYTPELEADVLVSLTFSSFDAPLEDLALSSSDGAGVLVLDTGGGGSDMLVVKRDVLDF